MGTPIPTGDEVGIHRTGFQFSLKDNGTTNQKLAQVNAQSVIGNLGTSPANASYVAIGDLVAAAAEDAFLLMGG